MKRALCFLCLFFLASCGKTPQKVDDRPIVLVTLAPYALFVKTIVGETVKVETLVPPGADLHTYEIPPKTVEASIAAKVWFRVGEPFEQRIMRAIREQNREQVIINLQEGLSMIPSHDAIELGGCQGHTHSHAGDDLHTWMSPRLALKQAEVMYKILSAVFPQHASKYETNYRSLKRDLEALDIETARRLAPYVGEAVLVSHPALGYYCRDYNLLQLSVECEGKEPKPRDLEVTLQRAEQYKVRVALLQEGFNNRGATIIAEKLGIPTHTITPLAEEYFTTIRNLTGWIAQ